MNIGFVSVYPYRPHGHQVKFLEQKIKALGWSSYALVCDGNAKHCYLRELKGTGRSECAKCIAGGLRSFSFDQVDSAWRYWTENVVMPEHEVFVESSAYTLTRIESGEQRQSNLVMEKKQLLLPDSVNFYYATLKWIEHRKLDAVIAFNGRMDLTRAAIGACNTAGIPFVTHERPLFGHGLILNRNENCSSLKNIQKINRDYSAKPLTTEQAAIASKLAAERLTGGNPLEWKRYNTSAVKAPAWPVASSDLKVLVCPSSKNELLGHPDWATEWMDNTDALDIAVSKGLFKYKDLLIRFHPSWSIRFGNTSAYLCDSHYRQWCEKRGVAFIESSSKINTQDLIRLADIIVLNGSNTVFEAGVLGKPVICLGPSPYTYSGAACDILTVNDFNKVNLSEMISSKPDLQVAHTLRYYYSKAGREPIYTNYIRSRSVTECDFYDGGNPEILKSLIKEDRQCVDDGNFSNDINPEREFVNKFIEGDWRDLAELSSFAWRGSCSEKLRISRKIPYNVIDPLRGIFPKGV